MTRPPPRAVIAIFIGAWALHFIGPKLEGRKLPC